MPNGYLHPTKITFTIEDAENTPEDKLLTESSVKATWGASDELLKLLADHNFVQRGKISWAISTNPDNVRAINRFLRVYSEKFMPATIVAKNTLDKSDETGYILPKAWPIMGVIWNEYDRTQPVLTPFNYNSLRPLMQRAMPGLQLPSTLTPDSYQNLVRELRNVREPAKQRSLVRTPRYLPWSTLGAVQMSVERNLLWVRLIPSSDLLEYKNLIHMPLYGATGARHSNPGNLPPHAFIPFLNAHKGIPESGLYQGNVETLNRLIETSNQRIIAGYAPNQPAKVLLHVGEKVKVAPQSKLGQFKRKNRGSSAVVTITEALNLKGKYADQFIIHESLDDIVAMDNAVPYEGEPRLKPYQKMAVGLHLATKIGYLQTCSPGMGKTPMALVAMRERAKTHANYRALVVSEANVRQQWKEEAEKWFPEATVCIIQKGTDVEKLAETLTLDTPIIVIMSYTHTLLAAEEQEKREEWANHLNTLLFRDRVKALQNKTVDELTVGAMILDERWHDICADEAMIIRNGTSQQAKIMWVLRQNSGVATALTATPINKSPDDIGRLLAWVRNDRNLFSGTPLSEQYQTTTAEGGRKLFNVFGPLVFRRDISEIADEMPDSVPVVTLIKPTPDEKALIYAAENELKRCYTELMVAIEDVEKAGTADKDAVAKAKEQLRAANGAWLGGKQLARMAASDPAALLDSESVGAGLLKGQGLIQAVLEKEPTKRKILIEHVQKHVQAGKQVVVFTDYKTVATILAEKLEENGIRAKTYLGTNGATRDRNRIAFQNGEIDVLICTKAGERGLTLHRASVIINFDLPWALERVIQRAGRGIRLGSKNATVEIEYLVMKDTLEQDIAEHLVTLAASSLFVLDNSRGVDVKKTETAQAIGGLADAFGGKKANKKHLVALRDILKV